MKRALILLAASMLAAGCTPNIVDRDFEKEELEYVKKYGEPADDPLWGAPTARSVFAGKKDGIRISMYRGTDSVIGRDRLQVWYASLFNNNDEDKCVQVNWQLMDFEMIQEHAGFRFVEARETILNYARFLQKVWVIDGLRLVLPPSGYIADIIVEDPDQKAEPGHECEFFVKEEDVEVK